MLYLLLAILSSAMVSIVMRLSSHRVSGNISMLAMNYLMCVAVAACYTGFGKLILSFAMLFGRLEIYPVLVLFSASTWKK